MRALAFFPFGLPLNGDTRRALDFFVGVRSTKGIPGAMFSLLSLRITDVLGDALGEVVDEEAGDAEGEPGEAGADGFAKMETSDEVIADASSWSKAR